MDETSPSKEGMHGLAAALADTKFLSLGIPSSQSILGSPAQPDLRAEPIKKTRGAICHQRISMTTKCSFFFLTGESIKPRVEIS